MIESLRGHALSPTFMNPDIIAGLIYEHKIVEPMVVQKLDEKNTLLVFTGGVDTEKNRSIRPVLI